VKGGVAWIKLKKAKKLGKPGNWRNLIGYKVERLITTDGEELSWALGTKKLAKNERLQEKGTLNWKTGLLIIWTRDPSREPPAAGREKSLAGT